MRKRDKVKQKLKHNPLTHYVRTKTADKIEAKAKRKSEESAKRIVEETVEPMIERRIEHAVDEARSSASWIINHTFDRTERLVFVVAIIIALLALLAVIR